MPDPVGHDIIVLGTSAGGVEALLTLVPQLPEDLPASLFIVLHIPAHHASLLPEIVGRATALPVKHGEDGETIRRGQIYVAPPDYHLLIDPGCVRLGHGPRENRARPAIDPLFRSAAAAYTTRVIGVLLTGQLSDGTAGLYEIKRCGGIVVVQDPIEALYPDMPRNAIENVDVDHSVPLREMGRTLVELVQAPAPAPPPVPDVLPAEVGYARAHQPRSTGGADMRVAASFSCPDCGGMLWLQPDRELPQYRCRVGHAFTAGSLIEAQADAVEDALWTSARLLQESAEALRALANHAAQAGDELKRAAYQAQAAELDAREQCLREQCAGAMGANDPRGR